MEDLTCMSYTSRGTSEILVAGTKEVMFTIDVDKGTITKEVLEILSYLRFLC
jgi:PAB-dependent poly(A)-specific ribonuclease subunit 2